jgi:hypothetical protein
MTTGGHALEQFDNLIDHPGVADPTEVIPGEHTVNIKDLPITLRLWMYV